MKFYNAFYKSNLVLAVHFLYNRLLNKNEFNIKVNF